MRSTAATTLPTYGLLGAAALTSFLLPGSLDVPGVFANPPSPPSQVTLTGLVRDFHEAHPDFDVVPAGGYGHYAGNVGQGLGADGRPVWVRPVNDFGLSGGQLVPGEPFVARAAVLGAAITSGGQNVPVTVKVVIGGDTLEPFGPFNQALAGNVNDNNNPRDAILPSADLYPAGTPIAVGGCSWLTQSSDDDDDGGWNKHIELFSGTNPPGIKVLKNGDPVPNIAALQDQATIETFLGEFIDTATDTVVLAGNQAIFLFELGTTNLTSSAADFQDLVVLITLATDQSYFVSDPTTGGEIAAGHRVQSQWLDAAGRPIAPHMARTSGTDACGAPLAGTAGSFGAAGTGGVSGEESFNEWYRNVLGVNQSSMAPITLVRNETDGVYELLTDEFFPIDDKLFGNEGDAHNFHFTYEFSAAFEYDSCTGQFVEFRGGDGAWMFINGEMVMDLGGVGANQVQRISLDRLGLTDGGTYDITFFYAQRDPANAAFHLRTNLLLESSGLTGGVTAAFD